MHTCTYRPVPSRTMLGNLSQHRLLKGSTPDTSHIVLRMSHG